MPVGLLDEIAEESRPPVVRCSVAVVLDDLPDAERKELEAAIADPATYTTSAICRVLNRRGFDMKHKRLANHRKGECACARG
jgi:hypothetical protein